MPSNNGVLHPNRIGMPMSKCLCQGECKCTALKNLCILANSDAKIVYCPPIWNYENGDDITDIVFTVVLGDAIALQLSLFLNPSQFIIEENQLTICILPADTASMAPGNYEYILKVTETDSDVIGIAKGSFCLEGDPSNTSEILPPAPVSCCASLLQSPPTNDDWVQRVLILDGVPTNANWHPVDLSTLIPVRANFAIGAFFINDDDDTGNDFYMSFRLPGIGREIDPLVFENAGTFGTIYNGSVPPIPLLNRQFEVNIQGTPIGSTSVTLALDLYGYM